MHGTFARLRGGAGGTAVLSGRRLLGRLMIDTLCERLIIHCRIVFQETGLGSVVRCAALGDGSVPPAFTDMKKR